MASAVTKKKTPAKPTPSRYAFQKGFKPKGITAKQVGDAIEKLREEYDYVTGELLLKAAKNPRHPLHQWLWKRVGDKEAADRWRKQQATRLISACVYITKAKKQQRVYANVTVTRKEDGRRRRGRVFVPTKEALGYEDEREQVLDEALRDLRGFVARYEDYANCDGLVTDIEKVLKKYIH